MLNSNLCRRTVKFGLPAPFSRWSRFYHDFLEGKSFITLSTVALSLLFSIASAQITAPEIEWQNNIGGSLYDYLYSVQQTADGGYILGGYSNSGITGDKTEASTQGGDDYWVVKLDSTGTIEWQNTIGGNSGEDLRSIQQTTDGGYILGGYSGSGISGDKTEASQGNYDYWIVKLNNTGAIEWQNTIGGSDDDRVQAIQQTTDGGYIVGGFSRSGISGDKTEASMFYDYWVVKLNSSGTIQWQNTIGGNANDWFSSVQQTADGGYIVGGYSPSGISGDKTEASQGGEDYWVVKLNSSGNIEWDNTIGGNTADGLPSVQQTTDGGYIVGGQSASGISGDKTENTIGPAFTADYWIVKLNSSGTIEWQNTIGGTGEDWFRSMQQTADGGYIIGGISYSGISGDKTEAAEGNDYWVVKLSSAGALQWENTIGGSLGELLQSIKQTADGGYILGGYSSSGISGDKTEASQGNFDYWVVKLYPDPCSGTEICNNAIDDNCNGQIDEGCITCDVPTSLTANNITSTSATLTWGAVPGANSYSVRYKAAGTSQWTKKNTNSNSKTLTNLLPGTKYFWEVKTKCDGGLKSGWSVKKNFTTLPQKESAAEPASVLGLQVYPNPASDVATIQFTLGYASHVRLEVCDVSGRKVTTLLNDELQPGEQSLHLTTSGFLKGVYFVRMISDFGIINRKLVMQ